MANLVKGQTPLTNQPVSIVFAVFFGAVQQGLMPKRTATRLEPVPKPLGLALLMVNTAQNQRNIPKEMLW
jgi:hypothetical protein